MKTGRMRRRHGAIWTDEEDARLRELWGVVGERTLRERLGRTARAIYCHAAELGLPPQVAVSKLVSVHQAARRLGLDDWQLNRFLDACAITATLRAPVGYQSKGHYRQRAVEFEQVEALLTQRETRTATRDGWARNEGTSPRRVEHAMERLGVGTWNAGFRCQVRLPTGVLEEVRAGAKGPWCAAWGAVLGAGELPCEAWLLGLAVHDLAFVAEPRDREWVEWMPQKPLSLARRLARRVAREAARREVALPRRAA